MSIFNTNEYFAKSPISQDLSRTLFNRENTHKTTFDSGKLIPIMIEEILPGDTLNLDYSYLIRTNTPITPVMDSAYIDMYFFFVPMRTIWDDWEKFNGANEDPWAQRGDFQIPYFVDTLASRTETFKSKSLADYLGLPVQKKILTGNDRNNIRISQLPARAYSKIWNDWFRDQNTQYAIKYNTNSTPLNLAEQDPINEDNDTFIKNCPYMVELAPVNKYQDYFTSALPSPQKGNAVTLPITGQAGVVFENALASGIQPRYLSQPGWFSQSGALIGSVAPGYNFLGASKSAPNPAGQSGYTIMQGAQSSTSQPQNAYLSAYADLNQAGTSITVNALREAFQIQKLLERDARGGTRYIEIIKNHFGIDSPDARLQRAEYLGGNRTPLNMETVLQTAGQATNTVLGTTGAYSATTDTNKGVEKSFTEHGYILGLATVRVQHSYSQGISKLWTRAQRFDFYWPALANLGEQPIYNYELFFTEYNSAVRPDSTTQLLNTGAFGYNEAWADYRYKLNQISGDFRPDIAQPLTTWTYTDNYAEKPTLSSNFMKSSKQNMAQTLYFQDQPQLIADFYFSNKITRILPLYSIPGLIDHN